VYVLFSANDLSSFSFRYAGLGNSLILGAEDIELGTTVVTIAGFVTEGTFVAKMRIKIRS
jgi:hypothetical protein